MGILISAARFKLHWNEAKGRIVFSDESTSEWFSFQVDALLALNSAFKAGKVIGIEVQVVRNQIMGSTLPLAPGGSLEKVFLDILIGEYSDKLDQEGQSWI